MALIKCPECDGMVSDKADICIHCGYPMKNTSEETSVKNKVMIYVDDIEYDMTDVAEYIDKKLVPPAANLFAKRTLIPKTVAIGFMEKAVINGLQKSYYYNKQNSLQSTQTSQNLSYEASRPKCPTCNSTNIQRISGTRKVAGALGFGIFSKTARSQYECINCGYKW